jgi:hypothetical protein
MQARCDKLGETRVARLCVCDAEVLQPSMLHQARCGHACYVDATHTQLVNLSACTPPCLLWRWQHPSSPTLGIVNNL